jgi:signal transduction histidine kinase
MVAVAWNSFRQIAPANAPRMPDYYTASMEKLIDAIQELSHARDVDTITEIVREAARNLTGADGATIVLRDGDQCHYADENAIAPLWKGKRFPMSMCVSGWVMMNAKPVVIKDIYSDARVPKSAYRPTFVKSLAMVPIRKNSPIGAIGNYWADNYEPSAEEMNILQALADTTSVALENVDLYQQLQTKVTELEESNHELSCFAWAASHDLQEPLRVITKEVTELEQHHTSIQDERAIDSIRIAAQSAGRLQRLIGDLVLHARSGKSESFVSVNLNDAMRNVMGDLKQVIDECGAEIACAELPLVTGNQNLLECLVRNLLSNAIKFRAANITPQITITCQPEGNDWLVSVKDNGIGVNHNNHSRIFGLLQKAHGAAGYTGSGIGLATCKKIVELHGGRIWVESAPGSGSIFCFTLPMKKT